jgi:hypothetical protein
VLSVKYLTRALLLLRTAACLAEKQQLPMSYSFEATILHVSHSSRDPNHDTTDVGSPTAENEQSLYKLTYILKIERTTLTNNQMSQ